MLVANDVRTKLRDVIDSAIPLRTFDIWIADAGWDAHRAAEPAASELIDSIQMRLVEYFNSDEPKDPKRLRADLTLILNNIVVSSPVGAGVRVPTKSAEASGPQPRFVPILLKASRRSTTGFRFTNIAVVDVAYRATRGTRRMKMSDKQATQWQQMRLWCLLHPGATAQIVTMRGAFHITYLPNVTGRDQKGTDAEGYLETAHK
jgi:hypothetical protein